MTEGTTLFKAEWGSRAYGTNTEHSDRDLIQVIIEPPEYITGLSEFRPKHTSTAEEGARSFADDTDMVTYGLQKFIGLAIDGNPQVMATLWLEDFIEYHELFDEIRANRDLCVSTNAGRKYMGYMKSQRYNLEGLKGGKTNRPELVHTHGYDTKFAMHAVRLGYQGIELMRTGNIVLPMQGPALEACLAIRAGKWPKQQALDLLASLESSLQQEIDTSEWPDHGDRESMNEILHDIYLQAWENNA